MPAPVETLSFFVYRFLSLVAKTEKGSETSCLVCVLDSCCVHDSSTPASVIFISSNIYTVIPLDGKVGFGNILVNHRLCLDKMSDEFGFPCSS